ncbi:glycine betaine ABC transporter substrate-binding protein [Motilibacter aurantiacus]|uniref:glycine betaine ABC transporter substrate-binding protein n=1 Tax=Motilibacter aurantiacus TaxID=2714955 RepID=UPI00140A2361|nr:glycine betaine ABC transporter substrate-binding protein [Motilibacter aurantiacus]NHC45842.1 glycine/betaine ABC transporter substrate-binding protein [Motilibacter aurantiacus]
MSASHLNRRFLLATLGATALALTGCGGGNDDTGATAGTEGSVAAGVDLDGVKIAVGSKEFTEQLVLGQIAVQALRAAGADVEDRTNITGTSTVRSALEGGDIDAYYEYTGTGWITILGNAAPVAGAQEQFDAVKKADATNKITWFAQAPANNTFAIAANEQAVAEFGVASLSDYGRLAAQDPEAAALCSSPEFITRDDGLPGVEKTYGFDLPNDRVIQLEPALVYQQVGQGDQCDFAVVFATDGQVAGQGLTVLEDDKAFFPPYNVAMTMREEAYSAHAEAYEQLFGAISEKLTGEQLTELNAKVDVEGEQAEDVAGEFLREAGIV